MAEIIIIPFIPILTLIIAMIVVRLILKTVRLAKMIIFLLPAIIGVTLYLKVGLGFRESVVVGAIMGFIPAVYVNVLGDFDACLSSLRRRKRRLLR